MGYYIEILTAHICQPQLHVLLLRSCSGRKINQSASAGSLVAMYQNSTYRSGGGNNFLWVVLSSLIIVILLFAVYINNRNSLGPVIADVNAATAAASLDTSDTALDTTSVVNPTQPAPEPVAEKPAGSEQPVVTTPAEPVTTPTEKPAEKPVEKPAEKPAPVPAPAGGTMAEYEIRKGDLIGKIAGRFGMKSDEIMKLNNLENPDKIKLGQKLKVRVQAIHKVGKNETVTSLASKYKVDTERIRKANGLDSDKLKADESLLIPMP